MRVPISPRECSAYIQLRRFGYSINHLAQAFGRSTSLVHATLRKARQLGIHILKVNDVRKIPRRIRELHARFSPRTLRKYLAEWEQWILSEEGEPP